MTRHTDHDTTLGLPLCSECYRYDQHLIWQWWAPELWRRFTINLTRALADHLNTTPGKLREVASVQYAKVAEVQARGAIHFHALIRLDGPAAQGIGAPAPHDITTENLAALAEAAARRVTYLAPSPADGIPSTLLRFGAQVDVKAVTTSNRTDDPDQVLQPAQVAAYLAKYATKDANDASIYRNNPHFNRITSLCTEWATQASIRDARRHAGLPVPGPLAKDGTDPYRHIGKWRHMLGFRGHFSTKSRRYSLTLGSLRRARARFQSLLAAHQGQEPLTLAFTDLLTDPDQDDTTLIVKDWHYQATGWETSTDQALATAAANRAREYAQWKTTHKHPHPTKES